MVFRFRSGSTPTSPIRPPLVTRGQIFFSLSSFSLTRACLEAEAEIPEPIAAARPLFVVRVIRLALLSFSTHLEIYL